MTKKRVPNNGSPASANNKPDAKGRNSSAMLQSIRSRRRFFTTVFIHGRVPKLPSREDIEKVLGPRPGNVPADTTQTGQKNPDGKKQGTDLPPDERHGLRFRVYNGYLVKTVMVPAHTDDLTFVSIGKGESCNLKIENKFLSERHAELLIESGEVFLESKSNLPVWITRPDLENPENFRNDNVLLDCEVKPGDAIIAGNTLIVLTHMEGEPFGEYPDDKVLSKYLLSLIPRIMLGDGKESRRSPAPPSDGTENLPLLYDPDDEVSQPIPEGGQMEPDTIDPSEEVDSSEGETGAVPEEQMHSGLNDEQTCHVGEDGSNNADTENESVPGSISDCSASQPNDDGSAARQSLLDEISMQINELRKKRLQEKDNGFKPLDLEQVRSLSDSKAAGEVISNIGPEALSWTDIMDGGQDESVDGRKDDRRKDESGTEKIERKDESGTEKIEDDKIEVTISPELLDSGKYLFSIDLNDVESDSVGAGEAHAEITPPPSDEFEEGLGSIEISIDEDDGYEETAEADDVPNQKNPEDVPESSAKRTEAEMPDDEPLDDEPVGYKPMDGKPITAPSKPPGIPEDEIFDFSNEAELEDEESFPPPTPVHEAVFLMIRGREEHVFSIRSDEEKMRIGGEGSDATIKFSGKSLVLEASAGYYVNGKKHPSNTCTELSPGDVITGTADSASLSVCGISEKGMRYNVSGIHNSIPIILRHSSFLATRNAMKPALIQMENLLRKIPGPAESHARKCWINSMCQNLDEISEAEDDLQAKLAVRLIRSMKDFISIAAKSPNNKELFSLLEENSRSLELASFSITLENSLMEHAAINNSLLEDASNAMLLGNDAVLSFLARMTDSILPESIDESGYEQFIFSLAPKMLSKGIAAWVSDGRIILGKVSLHGEDNGNHWAFVSMIPGVEYPSWPGESGHVRIRSDCDQLILLTGKGSSGRAAHFYKLQKYISEISGLGESLRQSDNEKNDIILEALSIATALRFGTGSKNGYKKELKIISETNRGNARLAAGLLLGLLSDENNPENKKNPETTISDFIESTYLHHKGFIFRDLMAVGDLFNDISVENDGVLERLGTLLSGKRKSII
jgi:hypothetical protein